MLVLHEVAESPVEEEQVVEKGAESVRLLQGVQVGDPFVYLPLHQEDHSFGEESELLDLSRSHLEEGGAVDVVQGTVEIPVLYFRLGDLNQGPAHCLLGVVGPNAPLEGQQGSLLVQLGHLHQSLVVVHLAVVALDLLQLCDVLLALLQPPVLVVDLYPLDEDLREESAGAVCVEGRAQHREAVGVLAQRLVAQCAVQEDLGVVLLGL